MILALVYKFVIAFSIIFVFLLIARLITALEFSRVTSSNNAFTIGPRFGDTAPHNRIFGYTSGEALAYFHNVSLETSCGNTDKLKKLDLYKKILRAKCYLTIFYSIGLFLLIYVLDAGGVSSGYMIFLGFLVVAYALMGVKEGNFLTAAINIFEDNIEIFNSMEYTRTNDCLLIGSNHNVRNIHRILTFSSMVTVVKFWSFTFVIALLVLSSFDDRVATNWF